MGPSSVRAIESVAALNTHVSRSLYDFVRSRRAPVSRVEAAAYSGISPKLAAWHLDKLVAKGLLRTASPNGHRPRSVGRPPKLYAASPVAIEISLPERRSDLLAEVLAEAVETASAAESAREAALRLARTRGAALGEAVRSQLNLRSPAPARAMKLAQGILEKHAFEPAPDGPDRLLLCNCPFASVAQRNPGIVCRMNQGFVDGLMKGLGAEGAEAKLDPAPDRCCVVLQVRSDAFEREAYPSD